MKPLPVQLGVWCNMASDMTINVSQWGVEVRVEGGGGKAVEGGCGGPGGDGQSWNRCQAGRTD